MLELANKAMGLNFPVTLEGGSNTPRFDLFELVKMILKESEA